MYVLYVDHQGHPAPLTECFHATASRRLSSAIEDRFPPSTVTEVDSAFCPHCLSFHDAASAARLGFCPKTTCQRCPVCVSSVALVDVSDNLCYYQCHNCEWSSRECGLMVPLEGGESISKVELSRAAEELLVELSRRRQLDPSRSFNDYFSSVTSAWDKHTKPSRDYQKKSTFRLRSAKDKEKQQQDWSFDALEASLERKRLQHYPSATDKEDSPEITGSQPVSGIVLHRPSLDEESPDSSPPGPPESSDETTLTLESFQWQALGSPTVAALQRNNCLPLPTPLRVRRSRRCRAELAEGRPGILLKPKLNPLEGDSSLRTGHGQWWKKDSSAIHVIPRVRVLQCQVATQEGTSFRAFLLKVSNPTLGVIRLRFAASTYQGEPVWEDPSQRTVSLPHLLVDTLMQTRLDIELETNALQSLPATETVELLSAEDSIMELGGKAREPPEAVLEWDATKTAAGGGTSQARMNLVAQSTSDAWFELVVPEPAISVSSEDSKKPGLPIQLQVELGNGSWESSLIKPKVAQGDEKDWVNFDLVITWN